MFPFDIYLYRCMSFPIAGGCFSAFPKCSLDMVAQ